MNQKKTKKANSLALQISKRLTNAPLLIYPENINTILNIANGPIGLAHLSLPDKEDTMHQARHIGLILHGSVAVIAVNGFLHQHSGDVIIDQLLGGTSFETLREQFHTALNNPNVSAIVFDVDSPGGDVSGCFDLVDEIYNARGIKPICAVANEMAYAGAYAIASAAEKIYLPRTGGVGSVGVVYVHTDQSKFNEKLGVKYTPIYAGSHKADFDRHAPLSAAAQKARQDEINRIYELFISTVARNRNISPQAVRDTDAGLLFGENAVTAELADAVMPWGKVLDEMKKKAADDRTSRRVLFHAATGRSLS
jgi:signal peptide peptidase SppA